MSSIIEVIQKRTSVRSYSDEKLDVAKKEELTDFLRHISQGPFGNALRFQMVEVPEGNESELRKLGTYSMIRGAFLYLAGAVCRGERAMEDYGYCMESVVLKATELGIGTCWLGGSLDRSVFAARIGLGPQELIPAVSPLGIPGTKSTWLVTLLGTSRGTRNRKKPEELFYKGEAGQPMDLSNFGPYHTVLESVRLAPSARNKQPWRIIKEDGRDTYHFFMDEDEGYNRSRGEIRIQNVDMGIAMCHFALSAQALSLNGRLTVESEHLEAPGLVYVASWVSK